MCVYHTVSIRAAPHGPHSSWPQGAAVREPALRHCSTSSSRLGVAVGAPHTAYALYKSPRPRAAATSTTHNSICITSSSVASSPSPASSSLSFVHLQLAATRTTVPSRLQPSSPATSARRPSPFIYSASKDSFWRVVVPDRSALCGGAVNSRIKPPAEQ